MSSQQIAVQEVEENHGVMILTTRKRGRRKKNRNDVEKNIPNKVYGHRFSNDENIKQFIHMMSYMERRGMVVITWKFNRQKAEFTKGDLLWKYLKLNYPKIVDRFIKQT